ncbi:MAG: sugar ABC transporter ATP-binding protein [Synergistaceae bacterium]|jgi:ABC-type sugar transport system ATPase subunit|nr:sugar ABC transporter ATP-binding protein [Synergistaceae bacterium]
MSEKQAVVSVKNVSKTFPGINALTKVSVDFYAGEVHILLGENGAGKSTLIRVISGVYQRDEGEIYYNGGLIAFKDPKQAIQSGISVIHQELSLVEDLTIAENIYLCREPKKKFGDFIDKRRLNADTKELLAVLGQELNPRTIVRNLSTAQKQMVEIAKAISRNARVVVMDEPTSSLSEQEVRSLFKIIGQLKAKQVAIIYISHRIDEFSRIGDKVTIMRDGLVVDTVMLHKITQQQMISKMVGRDFNFDYHKTKAPIGEIALELRNFERKGAFEDISLHVHFGEVVGIAGLIGAGRTEILRCIFAADSIDSGQLLLKGKPTRFKSSGDAIERGVALVPEDRHSHGLLLSKPIYENISLPSIGTTARLGFINKKWEKRKGREHCAKLNVKTPGIETFCKNLSGGNQQKVILARWVLSNSRILLLDEPTRGIDIWAKQEIYELIANFTMQGKSILIVSSELTELLGICDRIYVMREGRFTGHLTRQEFSEETVMRLASFH